MNLADQVAILQNQQNKEKLFGMLEDMFYKMRLDPSIVMNIDMTVDNDWATLGPYAKGILGVQHLKISVTWRPPE